MFRNLFQDPKPGNPDELLEVCNELDLNPAQCRVTICDYSGENDDPYDGWCAEVTGEDSEGRSQTFDTIAWSSLDAIRNDLKSVGLTDITVE